MKWYVKLLNKLGIYTKKQYETDIDNLEEDKYNLLCESTELSTDLFKLKHDLKELKESNKIMSLQINEADKIILSQPKIKNQSEVNYKINSVKPFSELEEKEFDYSKNQIIKMVIEDLRYLLKDNRNFTIINDHELRLKLITKVVDLDD